MLDWWGTQQGIAVYKHATPTSASFGVPGRIAGQTHERVIAQAVNDTSRCPWGGYHVHMERWSMNKDVAKHPDAVGSTTGAKSYPSVTGPAYRVWYDSWNAATLP